MIQICRKQKAIKALNKHLANLPNRASDSSWEAQTSALLRKYLGEMNDLYVRSTKFKLTTSVTFGSKNGPPITTKSDHTQDGIGLLQESIRFIEQNGLYKPPCKGMISIYVLWSCIVAAFFIGVWVGTWYKPDKWPF